MPYSVSPQRATVVFRFQAKGNVGRTAELLSALAGVYYSTGDVIELLTADAYWSPTPAQRIDAITRFMEQHAR